MCKNWEGKQCCIIHWIWRSPTQRLDKVGWNKFCDQYAYVLYRQVNYIAKTIGENDCYFNKCDIGCHGIVVNAATCHFGARGLLPRSCIVKPWLWRACHLIHLTILRMFLAPILACMYTNMVTIHSVMFQTNVNRTFREYKIVNNSMFVSRYRDPQLQVGKMYSYCLFASIIQYNCW